MTDHGLGTFGVFGGVVTQPQAHGIEALGYGTIWVGGSPSGDLRWAEPMLEATTGLTVASGIVNIWTADVEALATSFHRIESRYPGRFLLGIGVGHPEADSEYRRPLAAMERFLDGLDHYGVPQSRRILAAIGPKMLDLAANRCAGAHPYLTTPEHTAIARLAMGTAALLAPEHKVVLSQDVGLARRTGRATLARYLSLGNARRTFERLGFTDDDISAPGSDRLVDTLVVHGSDEAVGRRLAGHLDAGADHVAVQVLGPPEQLLDTLTTLSGPLGL